MNFFETLIRPDHEDPSDRAEVARAANLLQVGEFQLLQLAYEEWYGRRLPEALVDRLFAAYMFHNEVPHWARQYARNILRLEEEGRLDDRDPAYHRYDADYHTHVPNGVRRFVVAAGVVILCLGGGLAIAEYAVGKGGGSVLPPYFERGELPEAR